MKKKCLSTLILILMSFSLYPCDGSTLYSCGNLDQIIQDAENNCCAGSYNFIVDCDGGPGTFIYVVADGPNSSCAPE